MKDAARRILYIIAPQHLWDSAPLATLIELKRGGATYVREPVVRDGTILTASGPEASEAFGAALVQLVEP